MSKRGSVLSLVAVLCFLVGPAPVSGQWVKDGTPVCTMVGAQSVPKVISDQAGGVVIAWLDYRSGETYDIYVSRIDRQGNAVWSPSGIPVCTAPDDQTNIAMIPDGTGGAIIAWDDYRNGAYGNQDIFAQRVNGNGAMQWAANGVAICTAAGDQYGSSLISDGEGGAIISWNDGRSGNVDIYAQRISGAGEVRWATDGVGVCTQSGNQTGAQMVPDGSLGALIVWEDNRGSDGDIYAQRMDPNGHGLWTADGIPICTAVNNQYYPQMTDIYGGAILVWVDERDGFQDLYTQKMDTNGNLWWDYNGKLVCPGMSPKGGPAIVTDQAEGAIIAWVDYRAEDGNGETYAQRFDSFGNPRWDVYGELVFHTYGETIHRMISDGSGGAILTLDAYYDMQWSSDIYAQKIDANGKLQWGPRGVAVCAAHNVQLMPALVSDGDGGVIVAWEDDRSGVIGETDLYSQRLAAGGPWGRPEPSIVSCSDLPGDQGGWVRIGVRASTLDVAEEKDYPIAGYNVWRQIAPSGPDAAALSGGSASAAERSRLLALFASPEKLAGVELTKEQALALGFPGGEWESVAYQFATRNTIYSIAAPTRNDSTSAGKPWEIYIVTAHTSVAGVYVLSQPDTGYSVDNLAPGPTPAFAGQESADPAGLVLSWSANDAPDIARYEAYRGAADDFVPEPSNLIGSTDKLLVLDSGWARQYNFYYKLVAVDRHGNRSPASLLRPEDVKVGTLLQSFTSAYFAGAVTISWTLSEAGASMEFFVLRAETEGGAFNELVSPEISREGLSFTYVDTGCEPGTSYRYRVEVTDESARRLLFETGAIATPSMPLTLYQNRPNPFNPSTTIGFYLPVASSVTLDVYDSSGRLVSRLADSQQMTKGTHQVEWRGVDGRGHRVSSGVYFYRLTAGKETTSKKMVLVR